MRYATQNLIVPDEPDEINRAASSELLHCDCDRISTMSHCYSWDNNLTYIIFVLLSGYAHDLDSDKKNTLFYD